MGRHRAGHRPGERLQDQPRRSAAPGYHRPRLPLHRQHSVRAEAPGRRLRFPVDAPFDLRADQPAEVERHHLRRDDEEDPGPRLPDRRSAGAPFPPVVRQVTVLQFPAIVQNRSRPHAALVRPRGAPRASARGRHTAFSHGHRSVQSHLPEPASVSADYRSFYRGRPVMVTGGLGFIGSNLARQLVELGADVLLVDSLIPDYGGNLFNIDGVADRLHVNIADIRQQSTMNYLVRNQAIIFNLAGQVSHIDSMQDPFTDLEINCRSQLALLDTCRRVAPEIKVVFASTRQIYGRVAEEHLPVDERQPPSPVDVNGINKLAGERYHVLYNNVYGIRTSVLRLTNTYGPRMLVKNNRQTAIGWLIRQVMDGETITIFGDGLQLRDFTYVDDAVEAFLMAGANDAANGQVFNVGATEPVSLRELAELLIEAAGTGSYELVPFPPERKAIDIGSIYVDDRKIRRVLKWRPHVDMREGLSRTIDFYRAHRSEYWAQPEPAAV